MWTTLASIGATIVQWALKWTVPVVAFFAGTKYAKRKQTEDALDKSRRRHEINDWGRRASDDDLSKWL